MGRTDPCVAVCKLVRLVWFVWVRRRGQGARKERISSSGCRRQGLGPGGQRSHHLSEAKQSVGTAKRRDAEAREVSVKKTTVRLTVMASSLMALLLAGGAHWSRH